MKLDSKLAIASFIMLGIGISLAFADMKYGLNLGILPGAFMLGYVTLFCLFLYYNHEIARNEEPSEKSVRDYQQGAIIWGIGALVGAGLSILGLFMGSDMLAGGGATIAGISLCPLLYCLLGWDDIKRGGRP